MHAAAGTCAKRAKKRGIREASPNGMVPQRGAGLSPGRSALGSRVENQTGGLNGRRNRGTRGHRTFLRSFRARTRSVSSRVTYPGLPPWAESCGPSGLSFPLSPQPEAFPGNWPSELPQHSGTCQKISGVGHEEHTPEHERVCLSADYQLKNSRRKIVPVSASKFEPVRVESESV